MNSEKWKKFFGDAGISPCDAATFAHKFADNRIEMDMLVELNKDNLGDMGITRVGDVIAILRHIKKTSMDERTVVTRPSSDIEKELQDIKTSVRGLESRLRNLENRVNFITSRQIIRQKMKSMCTNMQEIKRVDPRLAPQLNNHLNKCNTFAHPNSLRLFEG